MSQRLDDDAEFDTEPDLCERIDKLMELLIRHLDGDKTCPLCGQCYSQESIEVVREQRVDHPNTSRWTLLVHCSCCGTSSRITVPVPVPVPAMSDQPVTLDWLGAAPQRETPFPSELTPTERRACALRPPMSREDVLDVHVYLRDFEGDVSDLDF